MSTIIEFYGSPGVGKTTLADKSVDYLKKLGINAKDSKECLYIGLKNRLRNAEKTTAQAKLGNILMRTLPHKIGQKIVNFVEPSPFKSELVILFELQNPSLVNKLIEDVNEMYELKEGRMALNKMHDVYFRYQNIIENLNDADAEIVVMDDGFCKMGVDLYSLFYENKLVSDNREKLKRYIEYTSEKIDYAFFIDAEPRICDKRQRNRDYYGLNWKLETKNEQARLQAWKITQKNSKLIHNTLKKKGVESFKIRNNGSLKKSTNILKNYLQDIISQ